MITNPKFETHEIRAHNFKKAERKVLIFLMEKFPGIFPVFKMNEEMDCGKKAGLFLRCIKYVIKCIFADEAKCSASLDTTWPKIRSSTFEMLRDMSGRLTLRKRERRKKLHSLRAPAALRLLNLERHALRAERRAPLKQSPADCLDAGFSRPRRSCHPQPRPAARRRGSCQCDSHGVEPRHAGS